MDKEALINIHSNLFNNAIKYAATYIHIEVTSHPDKEYFQTRVSNDSNPIPVELREKVFEAFFQIKDKDKPDTSGSGIGLALVHSLVELHKGRVFIDDEKTDCSSFVLQIPLNIQSTGKESELSPSEKEELMEVDIENVENNEKNTILVVEDNDELQLFLSERLSKYYQVVLIMG